MSAPKILKAGIELREYKKKNVKAFCPLCGRDMKYIESRNQVVDHDHKTGRIRDILCRNCNGLEGKIHNLCVRAGVHIDNKDFLDNLIHYWREHEVRPNNIYYPGCTVLKNGTIKPPVKRRRRR